MAILRTEGVPGLPLHARVLSTIWTHLHRGSSWRQRGRAKLAHQPQYPGEQRTRYSDLGVFESLTIQIQNGKRVIVWSDHVAEAKFLPMRMEEDRGKTSWFPFEVAPSQQSSSERVRKPVEAVEKLFRGVREARLIRPHGTRRNNDSSRPCFRFNRCAASVPSKVFQQPQLLSVQSDARVRRSLNDNF